MSGKKGAEMFQASDLSARNRNRTRQAAMPIDIGNGVHPLSEYLEVPCDKLLPYRNKDPYDTIDKDSPKYRALVASIAEKNVYDAIIIRPILDEELKEQGYLFEILEGHHRTEASKDAGKKTIPARLIRDCDDALAQDIYQITNLLKKDQSIRDLAYGWWHFFKTTRYKSEAEVEELIAKGEVSKSYAVISESKGNKQLRRYARLHELTDEMLELVEKKSMSIKFGEQISHIDRNLQNDLLEYKTSLKSLEKAKKLRELAEGKIEGEEWSKKSIEHILFPNALPSEAKRTHDDRSFITALREIVPKEYHEDEKMLELIQVALNQYFTTQN